MLVMSEEQVLPGLRGELFWHDSAFRFLADTQRQHLPFLQITPSGINPRARACCSCGKSRVELANFLSSDFRDAALRARATDPTHSIVADFHDSDRQRTVCGRVNNAPSLTKARGKCMFLTSTTTLDPSHSSSFLYHKREWIKQPKEKRPPFDQETKE
ncbi:hypothetical protein IWX90DRAFT_227337 [Phyllosticta citrichinensis]|uniref:Uncharacterized protein n=1 Tax=Phyllosticta citrichinensis TaxID=1130410 RepID=A0ABR1XUE3_9PEZI